MSVGNPLITPPKISSRLRIASTVAVAVALLLAITALSIVEYFNLRQALLDDSRIEAQILADNVSAAVLFRDKKAADETIQTLRASPILNVVAVLLPDSSVFVYAESPRFEQAMPPTLLGGKKFEFSWHNLQITTPILHQGSLIGYIYSNKTLARLHRQTFIYAGYALGIGVLGLVLVWMVISRVQRAVAQVEKDLLAMAHIDSVTKLWNRNTFNEHLAASIELVKHNHHKIGLLLLDLDNFKAVNDHLGHHCGDALLAMVAQRLFNLLGEQDIVCRMGGDEFALVLQRPDIQALPLIADSITKLFAEPFVIENQELSITCSLGISIYPDDAPDQNTLVRYADTAMYQAKLGGKNTFLFFTREMSRALQRRAALEKGLRNAIAANELVLNFQPQYDLHTLKLVGAEALLRWYSEELGTISPIEFIPIAEESGLITPIGEWVLQAACNQMAEWHQLGLQLPVMSINFSAKQLRAPNLAQHILTVVAQAQIDPRLIEIELTESIMMENLHSLIEDFSTLQAKGIKLAIDDFGTGYSSMAYLKRLPLDRIKIDRAFVRDLPHNANDREIVAAMIAMAHNLGLFVTAEGVEQKNQADFLREVGCDTVQGFYFGKPMPANDLQTLLQSTQAAASSGGERA